MLPTVLLRRPTILVADDEEALRLYLARVLEEEGYRVITARDGSSALALIERAGDSVRLVITDVSMPNLSGPELARRMAARPPVPPVLFISGSHSGLDLPGPLLPKPFLAEELTRLVRRMVPVESPVPAVMPVHQGVTPSPSDEPPVDWERCHAGDEQRERQASPEKPGLQAGIHRTRDDQHQRVVHDLHNCDRERVRRQGEPGRIAQRQTRAEQRPHR